MWGEWLVDLTTYSPRIPKIPQWKFSLNPRRWGLGKQGWMSRECYSDAQELYLYKDLSTDFWTIVFNTVIFFAPSNNCIYQPGCAFGPPWVPVNQHPNLGYWGPQIPITGVEQGPWQLPSVEHLGLHPKSLAHPTKILGFGRHSNFEVGLIRKAARVFFFFWQTWMSKQAEMLR